MDILTITECSKSGTGIFLSVVSVFKLSSVFPFSLYKSYTYFGKLILKHLTFVDAIENGIFEMLLLVL